MITTQNIHKYVLIVLVMLIAINTNANDSTTISKRMQYAGFSGGMMLHTGFVQGSGNLTLNNASGTTVLDQKMKGAPFGIGGAIRFKFGQHLRVGSEGYVSTLNYKTNGEKHGSFSSIGWGGALIDCIWPFERVSPFIGGTIGGGSSKNLTLTEDAPVDTQTEQHTSYRKYGFIALVPFIGMEITATPHLRVMLKMDYIFNVSNKQNDFVTGPRFYVGFAFYREKNVD